MSYHFHFCDPVASFAIGSPGQQQRRIIDKWGCPQLGRDAWELGFKAYGALRKEDGNQVALADVRAFIDGSQSDMNGFFADLSEMGASGRLQLINPETGNPHTSPVGLDADWSWQVTAMLRLLSELPETPTMELVDSLGPFFAVACLCKLDEAVLSGLSDDNEGMVSSIVDATWLVEQLATSERIETAAKMQLAKLDSSRASLRAMLRYSTDPKQAAKRFVHECWKDWRARPSQYKSAAEFARSMLDKQPDALTSEVVVARWVRKWDRDAK